MVVVVSLGGVLPSGRAWRVAALMCALVVAAVLAPSPAAASDRCRTLGTGVVECRASGASSGGGAGSAGPLDRYLWVGFDAEVGECWYWSSRPGGYDPQDPVDALAISSNLRRLPPCPSARSGSAVAAAWEVFRSFPLAAPQPELSPPTGITGLPTFVTVASPAPLFHREVLPDGRVLRVDASVAEIVVDWGDGYRSEHGPGELSGYPSGASHTYRSKTCTAAYRSTHPAGALCHPTLDAYELEVTLVWSGRYSVGAAWIELGSVTTSATRRHDVDEIVGVRQS